MINRAPAIIILVFAAGAAVMDLRQGWCAERSDQERPATPSARELELICVHYRTTGQGYKCRKEWRDNHCVERLDARTESLGIKDANAEIRHVDINETMVRAIARRILTASLFSTGERLDR